MSKEVKDCIGIVIVNYNTYDELIGCIKSIREKIKCKYRIYVVDNGSNKEIKDQINNNLTGCDDLKLIMLSENLGYSGGNNVGIRKAIEEGCTHIAITNSDIVFENDAISEMLKDLEGEIAVVGPRVIKGDGSNGQYPLKTYSVFSAILDRMPFSYIKKATGYGEVHVENLDMTYSFYGMVLGWCFLVSSSVFNELGFFDDNVFLYSEERILSIKLKKLGLKACYEPQARVYHLEGQSTGKVGNPFADFHRYASDYYTIIRYCEGHVLGKRLLRVLRLFNFKMKVRKDSSYRWYYKKLITKMNEIDQGDFKISSGIER